MGDVDRRFVKVWEDIGARRQAGEPLQDILKRCTTSDLVAALAGAGEEDPVAQNAMATEVLNRQARAPFLGAFLVSLSFFVGVFVFDVLFTEGPLLAEASLRAYALAAMAGVSAAVSGVMWFAWRGHFRAPSRWLHRLRRRTF